ncbi:dienelactone hydrolase family protein [Marinobacterium lutimaris]|uniref:Carboxymethylenebutenolidase n=1 Tax=Marinobacterium lutimaris TaxID=568106 RepID=A0A1H6DQY7_9GAMM|nr:dienelactone hydrolase family protein [Marinobacterium lutimaris]SEG87106.1 carboxymethylenebutenolidase [Marinobacterium lutimaris]
MCDITGCGQKYSDKPLPTAPLEQRRAFLKGMAALPLAVVLADSQLAQAAGERMEKVSLALPGGQTANAYLALPEGVDKAPTVLLIHEWWGLNDQIKAVAAELAEQGFIALAVDLYNGEYGSTPEEANALRMALDSELATQTLVGWIDWLKQHPNSTGKVATLGWCFGGGWSLNASLATPVDATVIYYGSVAKTAAELAPLQSPVLGHFGTLDNNINEEMVGGFEKAMAEAGKTDLEVHWYVADHAFANPTGSRYDEEDAALAWSRTVSFLYKTLG